LAESLGPDECLAIISDANENFPRCCGRNYSIMHYSYLLKKRPPFVSVSERNADEKLCALYKSIVWATRPIENALNILELCGVCSSPAQRQ